MPPHLTAFAQFTTSEHLTTNLVLRLIQNLSRTASPAWTFPKMAPDDARALASRLSLSLITVHTARSCTGRPSPRGLSASSTHVAAPLLYPCRCAPACFDSSFSKRHTCSSTPRVADTAAFLTGWLSSDRDIEAGHPSFIRLIRFQTIGTCISRSPFVNQRHNVVMLPSSGHFSRRLASCVNQAAVGPLIKHSVLSKCACCPPHVTDFQGFPHVCAHVCAMS